MSEHQNSRYCFIATKSPHVRDRVYKLKMYMPYKNTIGDYTHYFLSGDNLAKPLFLSIINDQEDYSIDDLVAKISDGEFIENNSDSLISLAFASSKYFGCTSDFWGIVTHYWAKNEDTFICSNNVFLIAYLIDSDISQEAIFDYMFFISPLKDRSWFDKIRRLYPHQNLIYDCTTNKTKLSKPIDLAEGLIYNPKGCLELNDSINEFFRVLKKTIKNKAIALCITAGSDTRTILACLRKYNIPLKTFSFGTPQKVETQEIRQFVNKYNIPWELVDISGIEKNWKDIFYKSSIITNGLINPYRIHFHKLYNSIPYCYLISEGILGSEFVKGEVYVHPHGMISEHHSRVIKEGRSIEDVIDEDFKYLDDELREAMKDYIIAEYRDDLINVNTDEGLRKFQSFILGFSPSRIFAGPILLAKESHSLCYPFLSPNILRSIFGKKYGIAKYIILRTDFPGPINAIRVEAEIVRSMDKELYRSILDRGISFKDALEKPEIILKAIKTIRTRIKKIRFRKYDWKATKTDKIKKDIIPAYIKQLDEKNIPIKVDKLGSISLTELANISIIKDICSSLERIDFKKPIL